MTVRIAIRSFIADFHQRNGYAPSMREVAAGVGLSVSNTHRYLRMLRAYGEIAWEDSTPRTLRVVA